MTHQPRGSKGPSSGVHLELHVPGPGLATIELRRPAARNALGAEELGILNATLIECDEDPEIQAVVLTGSQGAFCAGADINALNRLQGVEMARYMDGWTQLLTRIVSMPKIVIVAMNGVSAGAGNHMAICSDLCVARADAIMHFTGSAKGIPSIELGALLLPMAVGLKRAKQILLCGGTVDADLALQMGLCNAVLPVDGWQEGLKQFCSPFGAKNRIAVAHTKTVLNQSAFQMLGALKLSVLAGNAYLSSAPDFTPGRESGPPSTR